MPRICFTDHAIDRFMERHAPRMNRTRARYLLERGAESATRLRTKTYKGQTQWQLDYPDVVLVTKNDNKEIICVTVLPEPAQEGIPYEEIEMVYARITESADVEALPSKPPAVIENELKQQENDLKQQELTTRKLEARLNYAVEQEAIAQLRAHYRRVEKLMSSDAPRCLRIALEFFAKSEDHEAMQTLHRISEVNPYFQYYIDQYVDDPEMLSNDIPEDSGIIVNSSLAETG